MGGKRERERCFVLTWSWCVYIKRWGVVRSIREPSCRTQPSHFTSAEPSADPQGERSSLLLSALFSSSNSLPAHRPSVNVYTLLSHLLFFLTDAQVYCWCVYHAGVLRSLDRDAGNGHRGTLSLLHTLPVYTLFAFIRVWIVNVDDYDYTRPPRKLLVNLLRCKSSYRAQ